MRLLVIGPEERKMELTAADGSGLDVDWVTDVPASTSAQFEACLDLDFTQDPQRIASLQKLAIPLMLVNAVEFSLGNDCPATWIRINAWPGFLERPVAECVVKEGEISSLLEAFIPAIGKKLSTAPDQPGMISARIVSCIINEAFLALQENVSSRSEIDTAMRLGTNYPFGPFEWAEKIGKKRIVALLNAMATDQPAYKPAGNLLSESSQ